MRYYNEAKTERIIRRKAMFTTFVVIFFLSGVAAFMASESTRDILPDQIKEWFQEEPAKKEVKPKKQDRA